MLRQRLPAVGAQFTQALASLALGMVAVRALDASGFGRYSLIISTLLVMTGLTTGLVGDTLTVLDRRHAGVRYALQVTAVGAALLCAVTVGVAGLLLDWFDGTQAPIAILAVFSFLLEDVLRRALMANDRFTSVLAVDLIYALTAGLILVAEARLGLLGLGGILFAMAIGQIVASVAAILLLPSDDRYLVRRSRGGARSVLSFGGWRAAQGVIGPARLWAARLMVASIVGLAAVGTLEANRMLVAPVLLAVQGVGAAILVSYSRTFHERPDRLGRMADRDALVLVVGSVASVLAVLGLAPVLGQILLGSTELVNRWAILGWGLVAVGVGASLPYANVTSIAGAPGSAVRIRMLDLVLSLVGVVALLTTTAAGRSYVLTPAVLGIVVCATALLQRRRCRRQLDRVILGRSPEPTPDDGGHDREPSIGERAPAPPVIARLWRAHWVGICAVALILASETKFVLKEELSGSGTAVDGFILFEVTIYALVGSYLLLRTNRSPSLAGATRLEVLLLAFVSLMAITVPLAPNPLYAGVRVMEAGVVLLLVREAQAAGQGWFLSFVKAFIGATGFLVIVGLTVPGQRGPLQIERFNWLATHPVIVGEFLALALVASVVLAGGLQWRLQASGQALLLWAATAVFAGALAANNTRGSGIAALAGVSLGLILILPRRLWPSAALVLLYSATLAALVGGPTILEWLSRGESAESLGSLNARLPLWQLAVTSVLQSDPAFGFGVGASRTIFVDETGLGGAHNAALNVMVDLGLAGLVVWGLILLVSGFIVLRHVPRTAQQGVERALWLSTMTVLLVNGATTEGVGGVANVGMIWLFVLSGWAAQIRRRGPLDVNGQVSTGVAPAPPGVPR